MAEPGVRTGPMRGGLAAWLLACLVLVGIACSSSWIPFSPPEPTPLPTKIPTVASSTSTSRPADATAVLESASMVFLPPYIPDALRRTLVIPAGLQQETDGSIAKIHVDVVPPGTPGAVSWVFALTAPFPTLADSVSEAEFRAIWQGDLPASLLMQGTEVKALLVDASTRAVLEKQLGPPGPLVQVHPTEQLLDLAWDIEDAWAIIPFEQLIPRWKVIGIGGQSPVQKSFDPEPYLLTVRFGLTGDLPPLPDQDFSGPIAPSNRDPGRLTTVALTGVTALVRATAGLMQVVGMTYPAKNIGSFLREADILHINNEVPFAENCPAPLPWEGLVFCSQERYIELLEEIGTDVVELSGDHFQDWGKEAMLFTLDLYRQRGWKYYGGGANITEATQPALFEHNGNRIAFLGCNAKPPGYSGASETNPGAVHCDFDQMEDSIAAVLREGYLPVVTFQHLEYYSYEANPYLVVDFERMADAGAVIVSGSQAHQPHAMAFYDGAFLHYGLGNLFFDQLDEGLPTRQAFIDRHVFYDGKYISTELISIWFVDYARPRPMQPDEREDLLRSVFRASGW